MEVVEGGLDGSFSAHEVADVGEGGLMTGGSLGGG